MQLGFWKKPRRLASRSQRGHVAKLDSKRSKARAAAGVELLAKADCEPQRFVREFRGAPGELTIGQELDVDLFAEIKAVDVTGTSKGRGTAGVMKRHSFNGQRATHGVKKVHRHAGSTGCNTYPGPHVQGPSHGRPPGGPSRRTARNLKVVRVDSENNLLLVRGAVPGPNGGYVIIRQTNKL